MGRTHGRHQRQCLGFFAMFTLVAKGLSLRAAFIPSKRSSAYLISRYTSNENESETAPTPMENLYQEWNLDQDQLLWNNKDKSSAELAALMGRGLRGVEARLTKIQDVSSMAYERLFGGVEDGAPEPPKEKLVPVSEVLRRVEWDYMLDAKDFSILHYDRVEDTVVESPMDAPNNGISGKETLLTKALPEHRIVGVKYKERVVWDRPARMDIVFSSPGIYEVVETYDDWKTERDRVQAWNKERQRMVAQRICSILGSDTYGQLQQLSSDLLEPGEASSTSTKSKVESYVQRALELFRQTRNEPNQSLEPSFIPMTDYLALDELSELVAVLPNAELRGLLLIEIASMMRRAEGKTATQAAPKVDVELLEEDLTETFVKGSGPGGQKVNKTSNRVLLVHEPTQLRVECQDTRSLQQNRKIARKRLKEKLDEHLNGSQSKVSMKHQKASTKRQKSKSKSRSRQRQKQIEKQTEQAQAPGPSDDEVGHY